MSRHRGAVVESSLAASLTSTLDQLRVALELGEGRIPEEMLARVHATLDRAGSRRSLSDDHTVVGIFGATGSGKSSLVNALSGTDAARVAVRRPTTSEPLAIVWRSAGSGELLDWLGVTQRVELPEGTPLLPGRAVQGVTTESRAGTLSGGGGGAGDQQFDAASANAPAGASEPAQGVRGTRGVLARFLRRRRDPGTDTAGHGPEGRSQGTAGAGSAPVHGRDDRGSSDGAQKTLAAPMLSAPAARAGDRGIRAGDTADAAGDRTAPDGDQAGLILLDLPDFDSTALAHREIVERLAGQVDVLVWVVDPQKYADAALHHGFLRGLTSHATVTLVALNQVDRLAPADVASVLDSLTSILAEEGLAGVTVLGVSARTGAGLEELAARIRTLAETRAAATRRLAADASRAASELSTLAARHPAAIPSQEAQQALAARLGAAAGVPTVVDAVRSAYRRDAHAITGWPGTRWLARFRPDPLRRLNLRRQEVLPDHRRSSLALTLPAQGATVDQALRVFGDATAGDVVEPWRSSLRDAARSTAPRLTDALDAAVTGTDLETGRRAWWGLFGVLQWIAFAAFVAGLAWLGVLAVLGFLQLPAVDVPRVEGFPVPTLLIVGGVAGGILLAVIAALLARVGAARRARRVRRRLLEACGRVATDVVLAPVGAEVERCNAFRAAVTAAMHHA